MSQKAIRKEEKKLEDQINSLMKKQFISIYKQLKVFEGKYVKKNEEDKIYQIKNILNYKNEAIIISFKEDNTQNEILDRHTDPRLLIENNYFHIRRIQGENILENKYEIQKI